jgi:membrane protease YdiL (CAAX protease family)
LADYETNRPSRGEDSRVPLKRPAAAERLTAFLEVLLCSGFPTQIALGSTLVLLGVGQSDPNAFNLPYVVTLSLLDTIVVLGLIWFFLTARNERPRHVLFGTRPPGREASLGLTLTLASFVLAVIILAIIQQFAPQLHTVQENPLQNLMKTPRDAALFGVVVVIAGGVREEIQRAFLLHRFDRWLGGSVVGFFVTSVAFGAGHLPQGLDAVVATAALGAFWALVYLIRRSAIAPIVSHAGFNLLQLLQFLVIER